MKNININKRFLILPILIAVTLLSSCKKNNSTDDELNFYTEYYINGQFRSGIPFTGVSFSDFLIYDKKRHNNDDTIIPTLLMVTIDNYPDYFQDAMNELLNNKIDINISKFLISPVWSVRYYKPAYTSNNYIYIPVFPQAYSNSSQSAPSLDLNKESIPSLNLDTLIYIRSIVDVNSLPNNYLIIKSFKYIDITEGRTGNKYKGYIVEGEFDAYVTEAWYSENIFYLSTTNGLYRKTYHLENGKFRLFFSED